MSKVSVRGSVINMLFSAAEQNPEMTMGEIFHTFLRKSALNGKHFVEATDDELYNSLEKFLKETKEEHQEMTDEEFAVWTELKFPKEI